MKNDYPIPVARKFLILGVAANLAMLNPKSLVYLTACISIVYTIPMLDRMAIPRGQSISWLENK